MKILLRLTILLSLDACSGFTRAQPLFIAGQDPKPPGKVWQRVEQLSDDFNSDDLDMTKWQSSGGCRIPTAKDNTVSHPGACSPTEVL